MCIFVINGAINTQGAPNGVSYLKKVRGLSVSGDVMNGALQGIKVSCKVLKNLTVK